MSTISFPQHSFHTCEPNSRSATRENIAPSESWAAERAPYKDSSNNIVKVTGTVLVVSFEQPIAGRKGTTMNCEFSAQECWRSMQRRVIAGNNGSVFRGRAVPLVVAIRGER